MILLFFFSLIGRALEELRASLFSKLRRQQQFLVGPAVALTFNFVVSVSIILMNKLVCIIDCPRFLLILNFLYFTNFNEVPLLLLIDFRCLWNLDSIIQYFSHLFTMSVAGSWWPSLKLCPFFRLLLRSPPNSHHCWLLL